MEITSELKVKVTTNIPVKNNIGYKLKDAPWVQPARISVEESKWIDSPMFRNITLYLKMRWVFKANFLGKEYYCTIPHEWEYFCYHDGLFKPYKSYQEAVNDTTQNNGLNLFGLPIYKCHNRPEYHERPI